MNTKIDRPILRYHGGKWLLAKWIIGHFPKHRIYVEAMGGGGSVLMQKQRCYGEVYNEPENSAMDDGTLNDMYQPWL